MTTTLTTTDGAALAGGLIGSVLAFTIIFSLVYYVFLVIACWKIFEKAGEPGWKSLIPIYNNYILYKIVGMKTWFFVTFAVSFGMSFVSSFLSTSSDSSAIANLFIAFLMLASSVFTIVISIIQANRLSKVFGHGTGFTLGLIFLTGIFLLILGFDRSKYNTKLAKSWE